MRRIFFQSGGGLLLSAFFVLMTARSVFAQNDRPSRPSFGGVATGFQVGGEFFPPPNGSQLKSLLQGAEARIGNDPILITQLKITTFHTNGVPEMFITAADCAFYNTTKIASSPGPLNVRSADGQFSLEGVGFSWLNNTSILTISNVGSPGTELEFAL